MKIAIIGDIHFPDRADDLPTDFLTRIKEEKPDLLIYTGDLTSEKTLEVLKSLEIPLVIVEGNVDYLSFPKKEIIERDWAKILVFHSTEVYPRGDLEKIYKIAKKENCNVVIFGHTHLPLFTFWKDIFFINPGSATGAYSGEGVLPPRSFCILEINKNGLKISFEVIRKWK